MKRISAWLAAVLVAGVLTVPARAQVESALDLVPADALGFVVVNNIEEGNGKLAALVKRANFPAFDALATAKKEAGIDKGIDEKGTLVVALMAGDPDPIAIIFVPVTDYKQFVKQLGAKDASGKIVEVRGRTLIAQKGKYAALAQSGNKDMLEKTLAAKKSIAASVKPVLDFVEKSDASTVLTSKGVKQLGELARTGIKEAREGVANGPAEAQFMTVWFDALDGFLKSAGTDVTHVATGVSYDQKNGDLVVTSKALFAKGSGFAKAAAGYKAPKDSVLAGLPGGQFMMAAGGSVPEGFMQEMSSLGLAALRSQLPADKVKKLEKYYEQSAKGVTGMSMVMGLGKEGTPLFSGVAAILKVEDSKEYLASYAKSIDAMREVFKGIDLPAAPKYSLKKVKVGDLQVVELTTDMSAMMQGNPAVAQMMQGMFGKDGNLVASLAAADKNTVVMGYVPAKQITGLVEAVKAKKKGLMGDPQVMKTAKLLPDSPQWLLFISPSGSVEFTARMMKPVFPLPIPAYPKSPPFGLGVKVTAAGLEARVSVPSEAIQALGVYIQKVQGIQGGNVN